MKIIKYHFSAGNQTSKKLKVNVYTPKNITPLFLHISLRSLKDLRLLYTHKIFFNFFLDFEHKKKNPP